MWNYCCHLCSTSVSPPRTWTEMKDMTKNKEAEDKEPLEFCVPKTKRPSLMSQSSIESYESFSDQRKASNCSIMSDSSSYGLQVFGDLASVLETLQEADSSQTSLESIPEDGDTFQTENELSTGHLVFALTFESKENRFIVYLEQATDLPSRALNKCYDTFVKVSLLPSKTNRLSRTIKNAGNPKFHEEFIFQVQKKKQLRKRTLRISLFDYERQGRHDAVGHVLLSLTDVPLGPTKRYNLPMLAMSVPISNLGKVLMSLFYISERDRLTVTVYRGFNLRLDPSAHHPLKLPIKSDNYQTYVKITLMCSGEKVKTERSFSVPHSTSPVYNESYHFIVPPSYLEDTSIVVTVMAKGHLKQDAVVGRTVSGPYVCCGTDKKTHWGQMVSERKPILKWRTLYL